MSRSTDSSLNRGAPRIRDHETLRCIGRGAYGEVWIARSVTGAYRAVKVVWREDYDMDSVFEREFEGIMRYEPVSRSHAGLVDILQVGRNDDEGFYYYVMELADDAETGTDIDPDTYTPHTFTTEMMHRGPLSLEDCVEAGAVLAEGLGHLHANDLIHRDVKPSNVIYVDGQARLADIGLVALSGQRSFVGTEGFVPPEGPGTPVADIFSLGMVLYELSTGKDRLDFPDVPSDLKSSEDERELWRRVNRVVCKACASGAHERYQTGKEMADALRGEAPPAKSREWGLWIGAAAIVAITVVTTIALLKPNDPAPAPPPVGGTGQSPDKPIPTDLRIITSPEGAEVYTTDELLGTTPKHLEEIPPGVPVIYTIRMPGYKTTQIQYPLPTGESTGVVEVNLIPWIQPQQGEQWSNSMGMKFAPRQIGHVSSRPVEADIYYRFIEETNRPFEGGVHPYQEGSMDAPVYIVSIPSNDAEAFRAWLSEADRAGGFLSQEHYYRLETAEIFSSFPPDTDPFTAAEAGSEVPVETSRSYFCVVEKQQYGSVSIRTSPPGAEIFYKGEKIGETPHDISRVKVGMVEYELRAQGYLPMLIEGQVTPDALLPFSVDLKGDGAVVFGRDWTNSLGMQLVPLGDSLIAVCETKWKDYKIFAKERGYSVGNTRGKTTNAPVTGVSRYQAEEFCEWLTAKEREDGRLHETYTYRLPTDIEWSRAVGLPPERGMDPASKSGRIRGVFPWGFEWPPPASAGNFADRSATSNLGEENVLKDYYDSYRVVAQVMSEEPNERGLWDLSGNVWEWIQDSYGGPDPEKAVWGAVRGGSWRSFRQEELLSSFRKPMDPADSNDATGFRVVLARESIDSASSETITSSSTP